MKNFSLEGKVAVITGAGSGLGYATARRFHDAGAMVTMADINENTTAAAEEIGCFFVRTDVSKEADVENLMKTASEHYGPLDIVINNAGIICGEELLENADATEVANAIVFLASREASYITGESLVVDGGNTIQEYKGDSKFYY